MHSHVIERQIAGELNARPEQVQAAVRLLDEGSTVPFIARYRKEVTGGLDDSQLRTLESRLGYLRELEDRRRGADRGRRAPLRRVQLPPRHLAAAAADADRHRLPVGLGAVGRAHAALRLTLRRDIGAAAA